MKPVQCLNVADSAHLLAETSKVAISQTSLAGETHKISSLIYLVAEAVADHAKPAPYKPKQRLHLKNQYSAQHLISNRIGVIAPYISRWYFAEAINGIEQSLREVGMDLLLYNFSEVDARARIFQHKQLRGKVDALIVISMPHQELQLLNQMRLRRQ